MARERFRPEQIIPNLREAEVLLGNGQVLADVCRQPNITASTYYCQHRWFLSPFHRFEMSPFYRWRCPLTGCRRSACGHDLLSLCRVRSMREFDGPIRGAV